MGIKRQNEEKKLYVSLNKKIKEFKKLDIEMETLKILKDLEFDLIWKSNEELLFFHKAGFLILHNKKNNDGSIHYISLRDSELSKPPRSQVKQNYIDFSANCFGVGRLDYGDWFDGVLTNLKNIMFVTNIMEECPDELGFDLLCDILLVEDPETIINFLSNAPDAFYDFLNIDELTNIPDKSNKEILKNVCHPLLISYHVDYKDSFEDEFTKINNFNKNEARWRLSLRDELSFRENNPEIFCEKNIGISKKNKL